MKAFSSVKWTIKDVFNVFVATFFLELLFFIILNGVGVGAYLETIGDNIFLKGLINLGLYILQAIGMLLPLWYFAIKKYRIQMPEFGFEWVGTWKTILWVLGSYLFYLGVGIFLIMVFFSLGIESLGFQPQHSLFEIFGDDPVGIVIAILIAIVFAPLIEEIFFRGFVLQTLVSKIGITWGIIITALIFAAVHFEFQSIMPLIILSVVLNVLYVKTKSIWPGIIFHIFTNAVAFAALFILESGYLL